MARNGLCAVAALLVIVGTSSARAERSEWRRQNLQGYSAATWNMQGAAQAGDDRYTLCVGRPMKVPTWSINAFTTGAER